MAMGAIDGRARGGLRTARTFPATAGRLPNRRQLTGNQ